MAKQKPIKTARMPGTPRAQAVGMADYVAVLKDEDTDGTESGRQAFYQAGVARQAAFQRHLRSFLHERGVDDQVGGIGPPSVFPLVALRCTPEVAHLIGTLPEVEEVIRDAARFDMLSATGKA